MLQRLTGEPQWPLVCCSPTPLQNGPITHLNHLHVLRRRITIVWAKTTPHLDTPNSLYLYKCISPSKFAVETLEIPLEPPDTFPTTDGHVHRHRSTSPALTRGFRCPPPPRPGKPAQPIAPRVPAARLPPRARCGCRYRSAGRRRPNATVVPVPPSSISG